VNLRLITAGALGATGVALGAFGAHALKVQLGQIPEALAWWNTATTYLLIHAVAVGAISGGGRWSTIFWSIGAVIFSATLFAMALGAPRWLGAITPLGGSLLIIGWLSLLIAGTRKE
jgi:uncharacterized membrane protein YgdD (TMEM256/DUF423 family)